MRIRIRLSEALDELCSEGIAPDRVHVATACAPPTGGFRQSIDDLSIATHWRRPEYAGHGEHLGVLEPHDYLFETADSVCDQAVAYSSASVGDCCHATLKISVKDHLELRAVCDMFSRLGTLDIDATTVVA